MTIRRSKKKYKILDLCCKAGGAGEGYARAGFDVTGIDIEAQPNNPHKFVQMDMFEAIQAFAKDFDIIHASPPCQKYSCSTSSFRKAGKEYPDLIGQTRTELLKTGKPFIIENVMNAPLRKDIVLRGDVFGLKVIRKRIFEMNGFMIMQPLFGKIKGRVKDGDYVTVVGNGCYKTERKSQEPKFKKGTVLETWSYAMGIDWMKKERELSNAIPPAYTEWIGREIIRQLDQGVKPIFNQFIGTKKVSKMNLELTGEKKLKEIFNRNEDLTLKQAYHGLLSNEVDITQEKSNRLVKMLVDDGFLYKKGRGLYAVYTNQLSMF